MDYLRDSTGSIELPFTLANPVSANLILILGSTIVIILLKFLVSILEPTNYKLDMTAKEYCKSLAEIDNQLRFKRGQNGEFHHSVINKRNSEQQQRSIDCANELQQTNLVSESVAETNESGTSESTQPLGSVNLVYPNGWIPIVESSKVKPGTIRKVIIFGKDLIVTRSAVGNEVSILDPYCPHMGVHIGIGGQVTQVDNQSCVECPFHGWTFRASDGQCVKIPYQKNGIVSSRCSSGSSSSSTIPKMAKLGTWPCAEVDNFIYIWHHIDGQPPNWFLEPANELGSDEWQLAGRSCHRTNLELRDMHENGADMNHFEGIHNDLFILGNHITKLRPLNHLQLYFRHHWIPEWKPIIDNMGKITHMAEMKLQSWISFFKLRLFDITVRAKQIGPARVNLRYDSKWYGQGLLTMNAIPMGGRRTKYIQHIYTRRTLFQCFMAKWVLYGEIRQLERDFFIWNHKKNIRNPIFIPEDRTLKQFRMWYSQFYKRKRKITIQDQESTKVSENIVLSCNSKNNIDMF